MRWLLLFILLVGFAFRGNAQYFDTLHLHYAIGESALDKEQKQQLDSLASRIAGRKLLIYSYADYLGSESPNQHLSDRRAATVKSYLTGKGIPEALIMECTGLGQVPGSGSTAGAPVNRRTDIFIRKSNPAAVTTPPVVAKPLPRPEPSGKAQSEIAADKGIPVKEEEDSTAHITRIDLDWLQVDETLRLENISFYPGRADPLPSSYPEMDNLYRVMRDNPTLKIRLEGHVCCCIYPDGFFEDTPTWGLSVDRAFRMYKYLINRGISAERMQYKGFGRTRPIRDNERTSEEGQVNRRVEIRILQK